MTALPLEPLPSRVLAGRYTLLEPIGRGGMSIVWRAEDQLLRRLVAVKELQLPRTLPPREIEILRERLMREARAACAVLDPAAVTVHDVIEEGGTPYLVMELVRSRSLAQVLAGDGPLPPAEVARIGLALLGALAAAHRADVVHRDVKPGNVLITEDGRAMLTDFGIAATSTEVGLTAEGVLLGSPAYVAPERARGAPGGPESDLWSLGSTLYTAVEGTPAFEGPDQLATLRAVVDGRRRACQRAGPLAPVLAALLDRPASRRPDARELEGLLRGVLAAQQQRPATMPATVPATMPAGPAGPCYPSPERPEPAPQVRAAAPEPGNVRRRSGALIAAFVVVAVAGVLWSATHRGAGPAAAPAAATLIAGAQLVLPPGWHAGAGELGVSVSTRPGADAPGALLQADREAAVLTRGHRMVSVDGNRGDATWEYVQPGSHVLVRAIVVQGALWQAAAMLSDGQWPAEQDHARAVLRSFDPPG